MHGDKEEIITIPPMSIKLKRETFSRFCYKL